MCVFCRDFEQSESIAKQGCVSVFCRDFEQSDSIETMQRQLGLGPGVELPLGAKPVTSREAVARRILSDREDECVDIQKIRYDKGVCLGDGSVCSCMHVCVCGGGVGDCMWLFVVVESPGGIAYVFLAWGGGGGAIACGCTQAYVWMSASVSNLALLGFLHLYKVLLVAYVFPRPRTFARIWFFFFLSLF